MTTLTAERTEFRWDRLTYASALSYCLLVAGLSVGIVLPELREQFHINGVLAALHGSTFGIGLLVMGLRGVRIIDRVGRRRAFAIATAAMIAGVTSKGIPMSLAGVTINGRGLNFSAVGGSSLAGPMWKKAMGVVQDYLEPSNFDRPPKTQPKAPKKDKKKKKEMGV